MRVVVAPREAGYAAGDALREQHQTAETLLAQCHAREAHAPAPPFPWSVGLVAFAIGVLVTLGGLEVRRLLRSR